MKVLVKLHRSEGLLEAMFSRGEIEGGERPDDDVTFGPFEGVDICYDEISDWNGLTLARYQSEGTHGNGWYAVAERILQTHPSKVTQLYTVGLPYSDVNFEYLADEAV